MDIEADVDIDFFREQGWLFWGGQNSFKEKFRLVVGLLLYARSFENSSCELPKPGCPFFEALQGTSMQTGLRPFLTCQAPAS